MSPVPPVAPLVAPLAGLSTVRAARVALYADEAVLLAAGCRISRDAGLRGGRGVVSVLLTGSMGVARVALKIALRH